MTGACYKPCNLHTHLPPWLSGLAISEIQCSKSLVGLFGIASLASTVVVASNIGPSSTALLTSLNGSKFTAAHAKMGHSHMNSTSAVLAGDFSYLW